MPASITIESSVGTFEFSLEGELPIVSRRMTHRNQSDGLAAVSLISMSMKGWFEGENHSEVVAKYQQLIAVLKVSDIRVTYFDGNAYVLNEQVCIVESYDEPADWKQYNGDYNISFRYTEELSHGSYLNLNVSYHSPAGSYTFETTPLWSSKSDKVRGSAPGHDEETPAGVELGEVIAVTLTGELGGQNHNDLSNKMALMRQAFTRDGILNYGVWSNTVDVVSPPQFGPALPHYSCSFSVTVAYKSSYLYEFSAIRTYSRVHNMPDIRKRKHCLTDYVRENRQSSQEVTYVLSGRGDNLSIVRSLLRAVAWNLVTPGGVEMEGGTEVQDDILNKITVTIKRFYLTPILPNIEL
jgi:hypothetical protein